MYRFAALLLILALALAGLGVWALDLQARQARDVTRKLNLEDLETALRRSLAATGTIPPENQPTWCGILNHQTNQPVQNAVERLLRATEKYANPAKPFPADPRFRSTDRDYVYHKTSPASFELLAELEADANDTRVLAGCGTANAFDYVIVSPLRFSL